MFLSCSKKLLHRGGLREPRICTPYTYLPVHKKEQKQEYIFYHVPPPYFLTFRRHWNLYVVAVILKGHDLSWL